MVGIAALSFSCASAENGTANPRLKAASSAKRRMKTAFITAEYTTAITGEYPRKIRPMDLLDATRIAALVRNPGLDVRIVDRCSSTNALLLTEKPDHPVLLAAEEQTAGRGQHGRKWHAERGAVATFSILRRMRCTPQLLSGLSLAAGVAAVRALRALGAADVALKWPNDLLAGG